MPSSRATIRGETIRQRLGAFLQAETGSPVEIGVLRPLAGGASRDAFACDVHVLEGHDAGCHETVLRLDAGGKIYDWALERHEEAVILEEARRVGVPVPRVLWVGEDASILGRRFLLLERIEGESIGPRVVRSPSLAAAREKLPLEMAAALSRVHSLSAEGRLAFLVRPAAGESAVEAALSRLRSEVDRAGGSHPVVESALQWLRAHAPSREGEEHVVLHGDFRIGNLIVGKDGLAAVIDWEFSGVGDPHEDLAWPFVRDWRFGRDELVFAGLSDGEDFIAEYERSSGRRVDRERLAYWETIGNLRWAVGCRTQAHRHLSGDEPSVELACLGRRAAEMEWELLERIEAIAGGQSSFL